MIRGIVFAALFLCVLIGCSKDYDPFVVQSSKNDWAVLSKLSRTKNTDWYIESIVNYDGDLHIEGYHMEIIMPPPLEITARLISHSGPTKVKKHGEILGKSRISNSRKFDKKEMMEWLEQAYLQVFYRTGKEMIWEEIKIKLAGAERH